MSYDYNGRVYNDLRFLKDFFYSGNSYGADAIKNINEYIRTRQYNITISRAKYGILGKATYVSVNSRETQTPYFGIDDQTASKIREWAKSSNWDEAHSATIDIEVKFEPNDSRNENGINEAFRKFLLYEELMAKYKLSTDTNEKLEILKKVRKLKGSNREELNEKINNLKKSKEQNEKVNKSEPNNSLKENTSSKNNQATSSNNTEGENEKSEVDQRETADQMIARLKREGLEQEEKAREERENKNYRKAQRRLAEAKRKGELIEENARKMRETVAPIEKGLAEGFSGGILTGLRINYAQMSPTSEHDSSAFLTEEYAGDLAEHNVEFGVAFRKLMIGFGIGFSGEGQTGEGQYSMGISYDFLDLDKMLGLQKRDDFIILGLSVEGGISNSEFKDDYGDILRTSDYTFYGVGAHIKLFKYVYFSYAVGTVTGSKMRNGTDIDLKNSSYSKIAIGFSASM